ncbi:MAG: hypothetical protein ACSHX7_04845 [Luteolibacter sp.]
MKSISNIISIALIGCGAVGFAISSKPLLENNDENVPLNVLGINRSPYGEVFAMAMQGPIDTYFHAAQRGAEHVCDDPENCEHHKPSISEDLVAPGNKGFNDGLRMFVEGLGEGLEERTNPKAASAAHKFFLRRGVEDKLRFAYNLDPSHYGNYVSYHFFLTEPQLGTRPELTPRAAKLAFDTINYCFSKRDDPRHALTAAAAGENVLELMLNDRQFHPDAPKYTTRQMREALEIIDRAIGLYSHLSHEWTEKDLWKNLSDLRLAEIDDRFQFVLRMRDTHEQAIRRFEGHPSNQRVAN